MASGKIGRDLVIELSKAHEDATRVFYTIVRDPEGNAYGVPRLKSSPGWAPAWDREGHRYIIGSSFHETRSSCWDEMLRVWFTHGKDSDGRDWYVRGGGSSGSVVELDRHGAIRALRRNGLRVVRAEVREVA